MVIKRCCPESNNQDLSYVIKLDQEFFPNPWSDAAWKSLNWENHIALSAIDGNETIGFILLMMNQYEKLAHLLKILVLPNNRRKGVAEDLIVEAENIALGLDINRIYLEVSEENIQATTFYSKQNFKVLRAIKGFYQDGSTALTMEKECKAL